MTRTRFQIEGMHCVNCVMLIDGVLEDLPGVKSASTSYARQTVEIEYDETTVSEATLITTLAGVGYRATGIGSDADRP